jgi:hypothetical protein
LENSNKKSIAKATQKHPKAPLKHRLAVLFFALFLITAPQTTTQTAKV